MIPQTAPSLLNSQRAFGALSIPLVLALMLPTTTLAAEPGTAASQPITSEVRTNSNPQRKETTISLADLGFTKGWTFEGLESGHIRTFHFPMPRLSKIQGAMFRIGYVATDGLSSLSSLRVEVDGRPVRSRTLSEGGMHWMEVPVPADLLGNDRRNHVEVTLRAALMMSDDRCMDERASANFLHITPSSGLMLAADGNENSPAGLWESLPRSVTLSLPAEADQAHFASALALTRQLESSGRQVNVDRLPSLGDIVVAPILTLDTVIADLPGGPEALGKAGSTANTRALILPQKRILAFSPNADEWPAGLAEADWMPLARGTALSVAEAADFTPRALPSSTTEASFALLGANLDVQDVVRNAEWSIPLGPERAPAGRIPTQIRLGVTSPPPPDDTPMMLYAFADDILQGAYRLQGGTEYITVQMSAGTLRHAPDQLRIAIRRTPNNGDCRAVPTGYPVQISPASSVVFDRMIDTPRNFGDLPHHFATGVDLVVSPAVAAQAETNLTFISRLLEMNRYPYQGGHVIIADTPPASDRPFILISERPDALGEQTVRFDRGLIEVRDSEGNTLLNLGTSHELTIAQLAEHHSRLGLWIKPPSSAQLPDTPKRTLALTFDKVAFIDERGIALSLPAEQSDFASLAYPEHRSWLDLFGTYRYWFMALGWLLIAAILAHLYVKARSHKGSR